MCDDSIEHRQVFRTTITIIIFLFVIVVGGGFSFLVDVCAVFAASDSHLLPSLRSANHLPYCRIHFKCQAHYGAGLQRHD